MYCATLLTVMVQLETRWIWGTCVAAVARLAQAFLVAGREVGGG
jgi:hypothetical protein